MARPCPRFAPENGHFAISRMSALMGGQCLNLKYCHWPFGFGDGAADSIKDVSVEAPVLDGFEQVRGVDLLAAGQIGDGAGDLEDAVIGPGGE